MERVFDRTMSKENMRARGKLRLKEWERTSSGWPRTSGGWEIDSWAENGEQPPYWRPRKNWLSRKDNKLQKVDAMLRPAGEDREIEPERAKFIRETVEQWETEWLQEEEAKKAI